MDEADSGSRSSAEPEVLFARVAPEHKMQIAEALRAQGNIVAMTGDGVNDAPGAQGGRHRRLDGHLAAPTSRARPPTWCLPTTTSRASCYAVEEGRGVFDNIRRFVTYIFTSNVPEIVPFILFVMFGIPLPLTIIQILAIDLGTDIVPALALGTERPEPGVMERPPRSQSERLLSPRVLARAYLYLGPIQTAACMFAYFYAYWSTGWRPGMPMADTGYVYALATTMTFGAIVWTQIGNGLAQRTTTRSVFSVGLFSNRLLLVGFVSEVALLALLVYVPFLRDIFGFAPLRATDWVLLAALAPTLLIADEIRKFFVRRLRRTSERFQGIYRGRRAEWPRGIGVIVRIVIGGCGRVGSTLATESVDRVEPGFRDRPLRGGVRQSRRELLREHTCRQDVRPRHARGGRYRAGRCVRRRHERRQLQRGVGARGQGRLPRAACGRPHLRSQACGDLPATGACRDLFGRLVHSRDHGAAAAHGSHNRPEFR